MSTVMITGAGRGLGLEFATQYAEDGWAVHATVRSESAGETLRALDGNVTVHVLDVTDNQAVKTTSQALRGLAIDVLINNAGIYGPRGVAHTDLNYDEWIEVMRVNVFGPIMMSSAFLEQVAHSSQRKLITVSSLMGSISRAPGRDYPYRSSKAAVNAAMANFARDISDRDVTVAVLHPGWVQTDMGGRSADITTDVSISGMRSVIARLSPLDSGKFLNYDGTEIPW
ncbi:MAG: SDR family oxidoreductase [Pseudomonadota bacterium]